jgi:hypothetical protein
MLTSRSLAVSSCLQSHKTKDLRLHLESHGLNEKSVLIVDGE